MAKGRGLTVVKIKAPSDILEKARSKIENSKDAWANATIKGFMNDWAEWFNSYVIPQLIRLRLPPSTDDIAQNVANRVTPVAKAISRASNQYRQYKNAKLAQGLAPVPPQTTTF